MLKFINFKNKIVVMQYVYLIINFCANLHFCQAFDFFLFSNKDEKIIMFYLEIGYSLYEHKNTLHFSIFINFYKL